MHGVMLTACPVSNWFSAPLSIQHEECWEHKCCWLSS